ncbi:MULTISPECIES: hypothetical protein [Psychrobacter]|jgi:hypothetical protein|uniref:Uncharacterized protein n=1 Tax=Psychrobacter faecalis TaxID=180588 RepID=A0ABT9HIB5_9GAMM|nr:MULTISPECIES: hypothetical protein [Psychrobacter]MCG3860504.1 hypothetical protein [Psychrobacter sp. Ps5]MDP4545523.1 hypothetical protein [Psychrobacter faecalis]OAP68195.1 hypothetical protein A7325_04690 [Psychrobacter sp. SHUES1]PKG86785.1 hypothetical protein CXF58_04295 [Psychrobacter sp. Sarcosine-02u-2]TSB24003.1 hypothetical protein FOR85_04310 [Psychrobacter sp. YGAH215]
MTTVSDPSLQNKSQRGFAPLAIARIKGAQRANQIAIYLIYAAILAFMVFGTIASIKAFHNNQLLYQLFYNLPYALVALTIPITIYDALVIYRYRLNQPSMIAMSIGVSTVILLGGLLFADTAWLGLACWLGVAFLFKVSFKRFFNFLDAEETSENVKET